MVQSGVFADALTMTTATTPTPEPPAAKRLTRSSNDRVIAGVGGGLGRYFGVDPVVMRLMLIVLIFIGGAGLILYIAAWVIVPADDQEGAGNAGSIVRRTGVALGLVVLTMVAAAGGFWGFAFGGGTATAIVVIVVGAVLVGGAFTGGARWLILPAIALALSAGAVAASDLDVRGGVGERIYRPASDAQL